MEDYAERFNNFLRRSYHPDIALNALLVLNNIRHAFLIQPVDYRERSSRDPETARILATLRDVFYGFTYKEINQGVLVSLDKNIIQFPSQHTVTELGNLLSYPCAGDILFRRNYVVHYAFIYHQSRYDIMSVICNDVDESVTSLSHRIEQFILSLNRYLDAPMEYMMETSRLYTVDTVIEAVRSNRISVDIEEEVYNLFSNFDMDLLTILHDEDRLDIMDPQFREFLLTLLLLMKAEEEHENELFVISNEKERLAVHKIQFNKRMAWLRHVLEEQFGVHVTDQDVKEAYSTYFKE